LDEKGQGQGGGLSPPMPGFIFPNPKAGTTPAFDVNGQVKAAG